MATASKKKKKAQVSDPNGFQLRDPLVTWYGPHACEKCGKAIIKTGNGAPKLSLDAEDHNHHYPNFRWQEHVCHPKP